MARAKKSKSGTLSTLGSRERQIMEIVHRLKEAAVSEVRSELPNAPSYSSVRTMLRHLEGKGLLRHRRDGLRYVYRATESVDRVRTDALSELIRNFFDNSANAAMAAIVELDPHAIDESDLRRLQDRIASERKNRQDEGEPLKR
jgi:predicted transcriptional regulator